MELKCFRLVVLTAFLSLGFLQLQGESRSNRIDQSNQLPEVIPFKVIPSKIEPDDVQPLEENQYRLGGGVLINRSLLLTYYRNSFVVEITGNEATFAVALRLAFDYIKSYKEYDFIITSDFYLLENLSLRGRFYENFHPPVFYPNQISIDLPLFQVGIVSSRLKIGILKPVFDVIPMESYYLPVVFSVGRKNRLSEQDQNQKAVDYIGHALVLGHRDHPISYLITPHYDTGFLWQLKVKRFEFLLGLSNGEMGLDSNSAKTIISRFSYRDDFLSAGMAFQIGNLASVPIKENQHLGKVFLYFDFPYLTWGMESMVLLHGLRDLGALERSVKKEFLYRDGFFSPFTIYNDVSYDASSQIAPHMLYGLTAMTFFKLQIKDFSSVLHFSLYDPNLLSENKPMYQRRYRGMIRLSYRFTPFLLASFSYTYTYDRYFYNYSQFYDATEPREIHPIIDQDFYIGLAVSIY